MTTFPIVALLDGEVAAPAWFGDITDAVNDHETRVSALEQTTNAQVSYTTNGTMATSTGVGTEVAMTAWTGGASPTHVFKAGWVHELNIQGAGADAGTALQAGRIIIKVRKGVNTTSGQQLASLSMATVGNSQVISTSATRFVKNATGADISTQLGMTVTKNQGGNAILYGDADFPLMVTMRPIGLITELTNLAAIAVSIV